MQNFFEIIMSNYHIYIVALIAFCIDFITGLTKAYALKSISSEKLRKSIPKFTGYVALAVFICPSLEWLFQQDGIVKIGTIFIIATEMLSIIENVKEFVVIPDFVIKMVDKLNDKSNKNE